MKMNSIQNRKVGAFLAILGLTAACRDVSVTRICEPKISGSNGVSFVFKVEDKKTGKAVKDLDFSDLKVLDGGNSTGLESAQFSIGRPQNLAMRTLILLDGSGSLFDTNGALEKKIKEGVLNFIDHAVSREPNNRIAVYKFYGNREIVPVYAFSRARDESTSVETLKRLSPVLSPAELGALLAKNRSDDLNRLRKAVSEDNLVKKSASTALHFAISAAIDELQNESATAAVDHPLVSARSLVVFTDGRDEVTAGAMYEKSRNDVLDKAEKFKARPANMILSVGLAHGDVTIDEGLLSQMASSKGYSEGSPDSLGKVFEKFAEEIGLQTQKYYQFNMCSNRRGGKVDATLALSSSEIPFSYDASSFRDPNDSKECDADSQTFPTCNVEVREGGAVGMLPGGDRPSEDSECRWEAGFERKRVGLLGEGTSDLSFDEACAIALESSMKTLSTNGLCGTSDGSGAPRVYTRVNGTKIRSYPEMPEHIERDFERKYVGGAYFCKITKSLDCVTDRCIKK